MTGGYAIVTGAGSGIGAATALALASAGVDVVAVSRDPGRLREHPDRAEAGDRLVTVAADLTIAGEIDRVFTEAESIRGPVRYVVHSVGHDYRIGWYRDAGPASIESAIAALVTSPALVVARALRSMRGTGGAIGLISSGAANKPTPGRALYGASKIAVNRLVESVAAECEASAPGVAVFAVLPGRVDTPMQRRLIEAAADSPAAFGLDRFTSSTEVHPAREIGEAVAALVSAPDAHLNGRILRYRPEGWE